MKEAKTPTRRERVAEQMAAAAANREWHESRVADHEQRAARAAAEKAKAGPQGGRLRALAILAERLGTTPVTRAAVQQVERDRRGRMVPHRNLERDRSLRGKARIRARKAARR